jgi:hypothetical protein
MSTLGWDGWRIGDGFGLGWELGRGGVWCGVGG